MILSLIFGVCYLIPAMFFFYAAHKAFRFPDVESYFVRVFTGLILFKFALFHLFATFNIDIRDIVSDEITILATVVPLTLAVILVFIDNPNLKGYVPNEEEDV